MVIPDENNPNIVKPTASQGSLEEIGRTKFGQEARHTRRALRVINHNLVGAQAYPRVVNKRGPPQKREAGTKKKSDPVQHQVTRSRKQESCQEETKKLKPSVPSANVFGDCIFVDAEEPQPPQDQPVPMSLEEPESRPSEIDVMEEVEMEDIIVEEYVVDIDLSDAKDPFAVIDYVEDLYAHYREMESSGCASPDYMAQQYDINERMRAILIDWLIEVHDKFDLMSETLFLTVNLIDRFLSKQSVERKKLQLVGLVAMLVACKYEEVSVPVVGDLVLISDRAYTRKDVLEMEKLMLTTLQFDMSLPTAYVFMKRFLKAAQADKKVELTAFFLIELALVEYGMLKFPPSLLAASAVYTAQCTLHGFRRWSRTCERYTHYAENQLLECSRMMVGFHGKAATGKLTGVHRKYCSSKFEYIAKCCEPAHFLLEAET